ncbi:DEAD/DEAH box helicase [Infirmifilum sp. NZ]|uniref:DEAD/DEAH box helicase n=1 Tax=Infirmifilum sp. NZ TaxID=2926850 RepID=UPI0027A587D2|nr:DEAD/DEAH box helicase [Infirmifilum sp. NZ]UNQ72975.1 DEAD/DEAH box helicase [Infirmifilum sp. NZ]
MRGDELLDVVRNDSGHRVVYIYYEDAREPEPGPLVEEVLREKLLVEALRSRGITRLYRFQAEAIEKIRRGRNVFIIAGTGVGKTEAFLLPILERLLGEAEGIASLVYPTKALARDQLERIEWYAGRVFGFRVSALDGDTPEEERKRILLYPPRVLVTNPDMLHVTLHSAPEYRDLFGKTKYVVLDDAHVYSGVFGSHVHYVLRRFKRVLREKPTFVAASATVGNPSEFAEKLFGEEADIVDAGRTRKAPVFHVMLSPRARSRSSEVLWLLGKLSERGMKTIVFVDSHRIAESLAIQASGMGVRATVHRAGLLPEERRRVERALKSGELDAVIATPTLELGIDIGELDAAILYGVPPTFSKYLQRAGRVGRRRRTGYVFLLLGNDPISAYYERNPEEFFGQAPDPVFLEPENYEVVKVHLVAMAADAPVRPAELSGWERAQLEELVRLGYLKVIKSGFIAPTRSGLKFLREHENLRGVGDQVKIVTEGGKVIGYREKQMAIKELFPGAIYLHGGRSYLSIRFEGDRAVVKPLPSKVPPVVTSALYYTLPEEGEVHFEREVAGIRVSYLDLTVTDVVYGYATKTFPEGQTISQRLLEAELHYKFSTKGLLLEFQPVHEWSEMQNAEAFHAVEHALIYAGQLVLGASPTDMGGISFPSGHIFIYDSFPGGSGVTKALYHRLEEALRKAFDIVSRCTCEDGCPRCIFSPYCGNNNRILSRRRAERVLGEALTLKLRAERSQRSGKPLV